MKKRNYLFRFALAVWMLLNGVSLYGKAASNGPDLKMKWWTEAKFGMFLHWGLYSQTAGLWKGEPAKGAEHFMLYERIPWKEYAGIAKDFNPTEFDAEKWVLSAKKAGMKYLVITSKHHDGFAMFYSPSNDYNIKDRTPFGRDPMKELVAACRKHGLKFGFYYSLGRDWQDPDVLTNWPVKAGRSNSWDFPDEDSKVFNRYFKRKVIPQVTELLTNYGKIDILWFDTPEMISKNESLELRNLILKLQPECIINSRIGNGVGDYKVTEQKVVQGTETDPWEACITMSRNWSYNITDTAYKSPELLVRLLLETVSKGGNLLLNNGPTGKGTITPQAQVLLAQIGTWMKKNSAGIYETRPWKIPVENILDDQEKMKKITGEIIPEMSDAVNDAISKTIIPEVRFTRKDNKMYAFICSFESDSLLIRSLNISNAGVIRKVRILGSSKKTVWHQTEDGLIINLPKHKDEKINITGLEIDFK